MISDFVRFFGRDFRPGVGGGERRGGAGLEFPKFYEARDWDRRRKFSGARPRRNNRIFFIRPLRATPEALKLYIIFHSGDIN